MKKVRKILYVLSGLKIDIHYKEFKQKFYNYLQLQSYFKLLWKCCQFWILLFHLNLPMHSNNTNNYIKWSFSIMKDIIFMRTKAYNLIQIFQFIITNIERFYERKVLKITYKHVGHLCITKWFLCLNWKTINMNAIQKTYLDNEFLVLSTKDANSFYIINSKIRIYSCPVRMISIFCKHQEAILMKYYLSTFNFILSLTSNNCMTYVLSGW